MNLLKMGCLVVKGKRSACEGKKFFTNRRIAEASAAWARRRYSEVIIAYHCKHCGKWHIGSSLVPKRDRKE